jgi:8-oxo-dGTP diphosphatase
MARRFKDHVHSALAWQRAGDLTVAPMLPANAPVLAALALPEFYAITHAGEIGVDAQLQRLSRALEAGLKLVQLREPGLDPALREAFARTAVDLCHCHGARVLVNGDAALAASVGADGVHLPAHNLHA